MGSNPTWGTQLVDWINMPLIKDCSCGSDHETMPMDETFEGSGLVALVCIEHKRHEPCRPCMRASVKDN